MTTIDPPPSPPIRAFPRRTPGALRGQIKIHEGFDELPPDQDKATRIEDELAELKKRMGR